MAHLILPKGVWTKVFTDVTEQAWNFGYDGAPTSYLVHKVATGGATPTDTQDYDETGTIGRNPYPTLAPSFPSVLPAQIKDTESQDVYIFPIHASGKITY